jgi:hypothetical protein
MKYDVFISYSRKDYVNEHGEVISNSPVKSIIDFLDKEGISYWFDKDGIYSGREFVEVIANAIVDSKMMIFVSSNNSNNSLYTTGEIFEAIENKKLIIPVRIDDSQYNAKFKLLIRPLDYIDYTKVDALSDLLRAINMEKDIISEREEAEKKKRKEIEKRESKKLIKSEIEECVQEVHKLMSTRQLLVDRIYKKLRDIDVTQKVCPICGSKSNVENEYCQTCGWYFVGLSCIEDFDEKINQSLLVIARSRWEKIEELQTCIVDLKEQIRVLELRECTLIEDRGKLRLKIDRLSEERLRELEYQKVLETTSKVVNNTLDLVRKDSQINSMISNEKDFELALRGFIVEYLEREKNDEEN